MFGESLRPSVKIEKADAKMDPQQNIAATRAGRNIYSLKSAMLDDLQQV